MRKLPQVGIAFGDKETINRLILFSTQLDLPCLRNITVDRFYEISIMTVEEAGNINVQFQ